MGISGFNLRECGHKNGNSNEAVASQITLRSRLLWKLIVSLSSPSHFTTDGQSASPSCCLAPVGTHDQILSRGSDRYSMTSCGVLSDERAGQSFVVCLCLCHVYTYVHLHCFYIVTIYILLCTIYTRPLLVQALYSRLC
jgi:hypothetical protein